MESININLENYNETLKTLLRTSKSCTSCNCNVADTQSMPSSPPSIGRYGVHTNNYQTSTWTTGATSATNSSLAVDNQYVHKLITELSVLQRGEAQWRDEKTALLTEIDAQNSQVQLLVKLSADLCALKNDTNTRLISGKDVGRNQCSSLLNAPSLRTSVSTSGDSSYSTTFSRTCNSRAVTPNYMGSTRNVGRSKSPSSGKENEKNNNSGTEKYHIGSQHSEEDPLSPISETHMAWIGLPSLRLLSPILYENIISMLNDFIDCESQHSDLKKKFQDYQLEFRNTKTADKNELLSLLATAKIRDREIKTINSTLNSREEELERELGASNILDQVTVAFLAAPGGWKIFTDKSPNITFSSNDKDKGDTHTYDLYGSLNSSSSGPRSDPGPRKSLSVSWRSSSSESMINGDDNDVPSGIHNFRNRFGGREIEISTREGQRAIKDTSISPDMLPTMVSQAIAIVTSLVAKLHSSEESLSNALIELQSTQSSLRISREELSQMEEKNQKVESKLRGCLQADRSLRNDLDSATDLVEQQNSLIVASEAKVRTAPLTAYL